MEYSFLHEEDKENKNIAKSVSLINELTKNLNIEISKWLGEPFIDVVKQDRLDSIIRNIDENAWVISVDVDEFQEYPAGLKAVMWTCECLGYSYVTGILHDRVSADHRLHSIKPDIPLWKQCPEKIMLCDESVQCINKIVLHRKFVKLTIGNHNLKETTNGAVPKAYPLVVCVNHFKWFDSVIFKICTLKSWPGWAKERDKRLEKVRQFFHL